MGCRFLEPWAHFMALVLRWGFPLRLAGGHVCLSGTGLLVVDLEVHCGQRHPLAGGPVLKRKLAEPEPGNEQEVKAAGGAPPRFLLYTSCLGFPQC